MEIGRVFPVVPAILARLRKSYHILAIETGFSLVSKMICKKNIE